MILEIPPKPQEKPITPRIDTFWILSEVVARFDANGVITGFKVIRSFKRMDKEDKEKKVQEKEIKKEASQTKITIEEDEVR